MATAASEFVEKAAVLTWHLTRNHPMPDGNKRTAFVCLLEFVERNGRNWRIHPAQEEDDTVALFEGVAPAWCLGRSCVSGWSRISRDLFRRGRFAADGRRLVF